jgi:hypothetical protein
MNCLKFHTASPFFYSYLSSVPNNTSNTRIVRLKIGKEVNVGLMVQDWIRLLDDSMYPDLVED